MMCYHWTNELEVKDTTGTQMSPSKLDLHYEINNWYRLKFYYKRDDFTFPVVNFTFFSSNIPAAPVYFFSLELACYSKDCAQCSDFLDRAQLLTKDYSSESTSLLGWNHRYKRSLSWHSGWLYWYFYSFTYLLSSLYHIQCWVFCFACVCSVVCVHLCLCFWIVHSWSSLRFPLKIIFPIYLVNKSLIWFYIGYAHSIPDCRDMYM